eukprot:CAMPEP_0178526852 /NCGR_PEP_ID=MMETSP0696-20121128/30948_1 /TAXON_ID=265572 /ORGANISM="Extubocellulus spinifer, Strain CCMP396" /LENGTH=58 /DNA_ID=CAMNT_0020158383 /DNA_START=60 /DNA_END=236 /DNA_ORIENTATION=-
MSGSEYHGGIGTGGTVSSVAASLFGEAKVAVVGQPGELLRLQHVLLLRMLLLLLLGAD